MVAPETAGTLIGFTLQQGVAVAVCVMVAVIFAWAIVKLFRTATEERKEAHDAAAIERKEAGAALKQAHDDCRDERKLDRSEWLSALEKHTDAVNRISGRVDDLAAIARLKGAA